MTSNQQPQTNDNLPSAPKRTYPPRLNAGGGFVVWEDGMPVPVFAPAINKSQMSGLLTAMMSAPYSPTTDPETGEPVNYDARFAGMTMAEVMAYRLVEKASLGDNKSITELLDRILGKPKQSVESVGVTMSYKDYLEELARKENQTYEPVDPYATNAPANPYLDPPENVAIDITPDISIFNVDPEDEETEDDDWL